MVEFKGQVKRNLNERKFNGKNKKYCATGGADNGCPFFKLNNAFKWICTLYRLFLKLNAVQKRYERVDACLNSEEPPVLKTFIFRCDFNRTCEIVAASEKEARFIFSKRCGEDIVEVVEGNKIDYEYTV